MKRKLIKHQKKILSNKAYRSVISKSVINGIKNKLTKSIKSLLPRGWTSEDEAYLSRAVQGDQLHLAAVHCTALHIHHLHPANRDLQIRKSMNVKLSIKQYEN